MFNRKPCCGSCCPLDLKYVIKLEKPDILIWSLFQPFQGSFGSLEYHARMEILYMQFEMIQDLK